MTVSSIRGIGRQRSDGSPLALIRVDYPLALLAVGIVGPRARRIYLASHVEEPNVARVVRHVQDSHLSATGEGICRSPACPLALLLQPPEADLRPAIASSA